MQVTGSGRIEEEVVNNAFQKGRWREFSSPGMPTGGKVLLGFDRNNKTLIRVIGKSIYKFLRKRNYA